MSSTVLDILTYVIAIVVIVVARYLIPWIREEIKKDKYAEKLDKLDHFAQWVQDAVLFAQQVYWESSGEEKKALVEDILMKIIQKENIPERKERLPFFCFPRSSCRSGRRGRRTPS